MVFSIQDKSGDEYSAEFKFFKNELEYDPKVKKYIVNSTLIKKAMVIGTLNSENTYKFIDDNAPNFNLRINIDKIFTEEELKERFKSLL